MKKNILFIDRRIGFNRGGGEQVNLSLAHELQKIGYSITFLIGADNKNNIKIPLKEFKYYVAVSPYLVNLWQKLPTPLSIVMNYVDIFLFKMAVLKIIGRIINEENIEVIQLLSMPSLAYELQGKYKNIKIVTQFPGPPGKLIYTNQTKKLKNTFAPGDAFIQLKKINPLVKHIPNGINPDKFKKENNTSDFIRNKYGIDGDKKVFLSVGRLVPLKNYPFIMEVLIELKKKRDDFVYFIIGDGPLKEKIAGIIDEKNLSQNVKMLGAISNDEVAKYYFSSDIFLLFSDYESSGIVIIEAMTCGLPVVATNTGGVNEFIKDENNGFLVEKGDIKGYVLSIEKLMNDASLREKFSTEGRKKSSGYTWEKSARLFEKYFIL